MIHCSHCATGLSIPAAVPPGKKVRCGACRQVFLVPKPTGSTVNRPQIQNESASQTNLGLERRATDQQMTLESTANDQGQAFVHTQAMEQEQEQPPLPPPAKSKREDRPTAVSQFNIADLPVELRKKIHDPAQPVIHVQPERDQIKPLPDLKLGQEGATRKAFNLDKRGRPKTRTGVGSFDVSSLKDLMKDE